MGLLFLAQEGVGTAKMPSTTFYRSYSKTFKKPRRPFEKERLNSELKVVGEYGLRNKRELWRVQFALNKLRNAARVLLTLDEDDPKRIFEGNAILKRMRTYGLLEADKESLDYVLALNAPLGGGRPGRVKRRRMAQKAAAAGGGDDE